MPRLSRLHRARLPIVLIASLGLAGALPAAAGTTPAPAATPKPATVSKPTATSPSGGAKPQAAASSVVNEQARAVLGQTAQVYRGLKSYVFEGNSHSILTAQGQSQAFDLPFRLAAVKPGKFRSEIVNPMMSLVTVSDGSKTWVYVPQIGQYTEQASAAVVPPGGKAADAGTRLANGTPIQRYLLADEGLRGARVLQQATIDLGGAKLHCWVVEAQYGSPDSVRVKVSPTTLWIDQSTMLVARDSAAISTIATAGVQSASMTTVTTFSVATINEPVADSVFVFRPPADTRRVDSLQMPGAEQASSPMLGKPAKEFTLPDLTGKKQRLGALKGRVVLIDFWATWCGPCRREMPNIVKLHKELTAKGLSVVAVNVGEKASTVSAFLKKNGYALPVWLDEQSEVAQVYGASAIPTLVVIDRQGTVVAHQAGLQNEEGLRDMLKKAGLE